MTPVEHADLLRAAFCCHVFPALLDDVLQNDPERDAEGLFIPVVDWLNERLNDPNSVLAPVSRDAVRVDDEDIRQLRLAPGDSFHLPTFFTGDAWSRLPPAQVFMAISEWVRSPQHATAVETERGAAMGEGDPTPTTRLIVRRMPFSGRFIGVINRIEQHSASFAEDTATAAWLSLAGTFADALLALFPADTSAGRVAWISAGAALRNNSSRFDPGTRQQLERMAGILEQRESPPAISTSLLFEEVRTVERRLRRGLAATVQEVTADWRDDYKKLTYDEVIKLTGLARGTLSDDWRGAIWGDKPVCRKEGSRCYWLCSWLRVHENPERAKRKDDRRTGKSD